MKKLIVSMAAGVAIAAVPVSQANATGNNHPHGNSNPHNKVTICHATGSNSYVKISPNANGVIHGHVAHQHGNDIIPAFSYNSHGTTKHFPGQNWDAQGQAIYNNGCKQSQVIGGQGGGNQGGGQVLGDSVDSTPAQDQMVAPVGAVNAGSGYKAVSYATLAGLLGSVAAVAVGLRRLLGRA